MTAQLSLDPVIASHIAAINSFDVDAIMETFAADALVNDVSREFWGPEHIRAFVTKELAGDHVTMEPVEAVDNAGIGVCGAATRVTTTKRGYLTR
jgi:ketosteroid isomerase-like protein